MGQCRKTTFEMIQLKNGLSARLFGPWLNAERKETILFRQTRSEVAATMSLLSKGGVQSSNPDGGTSQHTARGESGLKKSQRSDLAILEMGDMGSTKQRNDFHFTLKRQQLDGSIVLQKVKLSNVTGLSLKEAQLAKWAAELLNLAGEARTDERHTSLICGSLQEQSEKPTEQRILGLRMDSIMSNSLEDSSSSLANAIETVKTLEINGEALRNFISVKAPKSHEFPTKFHAGSGSPQPRYRTRNWSWKRVARAKNKEASSYVEGSMSSTV